MVAFEYGGFDYGSFDAFRGDVVDPQFKLTDKWDRERMGLRTT